MSPRIPATAKQRHLDAPLLTFDLLDLLHQIKGEDVWKKGKRNAVTLLEGKGLRIVLIAMKKDSSISFHQTDSPISIQLLEGKIKLNTDNETVTITKGQLLSLHAWLRHNLEAMEESSFLLTLASSQLQYS